jgi:MinD-like ATPase involved in chromosome partitioning or flagellar assembly
MQPRITIVGGAYGSGKTEFAISYALQLAQKETVQVMLIDLDIVNPYFRSRDIAADLAEKGLTVISTEPGFEHSDLPALSPRIYSAFQNDRYQVVFDAGGDPAGARALGRFNRYFINEAYNFYIVVNPYRPDTRNMADTLQLIAGLTDSSRLKPNGLVANINLGRETTVAVWRQGLPFITELSETSKLPVVFQMVEQELFTSHRDFFEGIPVIPVSLRMLTPWLME